MASPDRSAFRSGRTIRPPAASPWRSAPPPPPQMANAPGASMGEAGRLPPQAVGRRLQGPILASLHRLEASGIGDPGPMGAVTGTGGQMGPLDFDPQGADFTAWV